MTARQRPSREQAHAEMDEVLDKLDWFDALDAEDQEAEAPVMMRTILRWSASICGPAILEAGYGPAVDPSDRAAVLEALSDRLGALQHFFASCETKAATSIAAVALEAHLVANGDAPRIFERIKGRSVKKNAFAVAHYQMLALEWEARLEGCGIPLAERRVSLCSAYGVTWEAVVKWKTRQVPDMFHEEVVRLRIEAAAYEGEQTLKMGISPDLQRLAFDGQAYRRLLTEAVS